MRERRNKLALIVGASIARKRKKKGLTQAQFAGILGITQDSLSRMESGIIAPKFSRLQDIADALSCPVTDLLRSESSAAQKHSEHIADIMRELPEPLQGVVVDLVENVVNVLKKLPGNND